ncbi:response regulator receiver domain-containing protein [Palleronia aestuarii]|uniref:Response regulator receiver domain-containing protein n=1 Tax=Palleronia aestuarii TaxID=568105 RepID=A0A2W7N9M5_9RHOB|nr:response regulator [Palleronia aestuarii]PZX16931.1 response regulator receiver domain-containing protein [Palleronia aestuarii]
MDTTSGATFDLKRVLLVEDSSVTKDLVELVLSHAGHTVTSVETGQAALDALFAEHFDVVLTDFHLPDFTGLEVVRRFLSERGERERPLFVAITGDTRGLLSDAENCELFDRVVPKPLDVDLVCDLVLEPVLPVSKRARPGTKRSASTTDGLGLAVLEWPIGIGPAPVPGLPGIDAILIREARDLQILWGINGANLLPVLDETGTLGASADVDVSTLSITRTDEVRKVVERFHERRADLHPDLARSEDPADRLLARIEITGATLSARMSHRHDGLVAWNTICDPGGIPALLTKLEKEGLVRTTFFERIHVCPSCRSACLIVREECPTCASSQLTDESYLHHFRCATQAPESAFVQGDDLVCPKCRRTLRHFGRDYDRPGIMTRCESCEATTVEPQVAFVCSRCTTRTPAEAVPTHDVMSASLTDTGRAYLRSGTAFLGPARRTLRFGDFPLELVIALNRAAAEYNESRQPFTLASIHYDGLDAIRQQHGALRARDSRRLWLEALQQTMSDRVVVARGTASDFVLLAGSQLEEARGQIDAARSEADRTVRDDLQATLRLFGPEDIAR